MIKNVSKRFVHSECVRSIKKLQFYISRTQQGTAIIESIVVIEIHTEHIIIVKILWRVFLND